MNVKPIFCTVNCLALLVFMKEIGAEQTHSRGAKCHDIICMHMQAPLHSRLASVGPSARAGEMLRGVELLEALHSQLM